jgi:hypothetical protein
MPCRDDLADLHSGRFVSQEQKNVSQDNHDARGIDSFIRSNRVTARCWIKKGVSRMRFNVTNVSYANGLAMGDNGDGNLYEWCALFILVCFCMLCCCIVAKYMHGKCARGPYAQMSIENNEEYSLNDGISQVVVEPEDEHSKMLGEKGRMEQQGTGIEMVDEDHEF